MRGMVMGLALLACGIANAADVVLVTGASRGIGYEISQLLAENNYIVYAGIRANSNTKDLDSLQVKYPDTLHLIELDVTNDKSIDAAVNKILADENRIDILVNNAGIAIWGSVENVTIDEAKAIFEVNFFGVMRLTQAVLPSMRAQKSGRIIQISSRSGFRPLPSLSLYAASKFALEGLSETMAATLAPWNIHVSMIEPAGVSTTFELIAPYGSKLDKENDPYYDIFAKADLLLDPTFTGAQTAREVAFVALEAIQARDPQLRYQTSDLVRRHASMRLVDITGNANVREWHRILFPLYRAE